MAENKTPSAAEWLNKRNQASAAATQVAEQNYNDKLAKLSQYQNEYASGSRNAIADILQQPQRDAQKEKRLKQVAAIGAIGDMVGAMGKGYAAYHGVKPTLTEGATTYKALAELGRLDDVYKQEGYNYNQQMIADSLRREQAAQNIMGHEVERAKDERNYQRGKQDRDKSAEENYNLLIEERELQKAEQLRREKVEDKRDNKRFSQQVSLSRLSGNGRSDKEFAISPGNVAMVVKNPKTGEFEPIADGDFAMALSEAKKINPKVDLALSSAQTQANYNQEAQMAVMSYLKSKGIEAHLQESQNATLDSITKNAQKMRENGHKSLSIASVRSMTGNMLSGLSDKEIAEQYAKNGIEILLR